MADPLLTSLCSICHMSPPVYKCPRCSIATCSVPCVKKHKAWSQCSGERDATAYVPPSKLRTVAGVNHDYNFLHGMDLSRERTERVLVDDRQILQAEDLLPPLTKQTVKWKAGRDGKQRRVLVTRVVPRRTKKRRMERLLGKRLRQLNIDVVFAPTGMSRQRWNKTAFNRHTRRISWQVEWLVFDTENQITRRLSKALDNVPLYKAYHDMEPKRQRKPIWNEEVQRIASSAWTPGLDTLQEPGTGQWRVYCGADVGAQWPAEADKEQRKRLQFFLKGRPRAANLGTTVCALEAHDCLADVLKNTRVFEFPTVYVLKAGKALPEGFVLGPRDVITTQSGIKRTRDAEEGECVSPKRQRRHVGIIEVEDGEVEDGEVEDGEAEDAEAEDEEVMSFGEEESDEQSDEQSEDESEDESQDESDSDEEEEQEEVVEEEIEQDGD